MAATTITTNNTNSDWLQQQMQAAKTDPYWMQQQMQAAGVYNGYGNLIGPALGIGQYIPVPGVQPQTQPFPPVPNMVNGLPSRPHDGDIAMVVYMRGAWYVQNEVFPEIQKKPVPEIGFSLDEINKAQDMIEDGCPA